MSDDLRKPNHLLRWHRRQRSWTLEDAARELHRFCESEPRAYVRGEINAKMIGSWERGDHTPSPYYQGKLRLLFGKSAEELGFVETPMLPEHLSVIYSSSIPQVSTSTLTPHQA